MMIDLNEDGRRKLHEICTKLGPHDEYKRRGRRARKQVP